MIRRARLLSVVAVLAMGAIGVLSSTQTWFVVTLDTGAQQELAVPGAAAVPVLAPLSLAALALGAALSIAGLVLRYVFGALTLGIGGAIGFLSAQAVFATPLSAVASTVTVATGITGPEGIALLVEAITSTPWPALTLASSLVLIAAGAFTLATARRWSRTGRRFESEPAPHTEPAAAAAESRPFDAIDSWDDLSRGADPTADPTAGPR